MTRQRRGWSRMGGMGLGALVVGAGFWVVSTGLAEPGASDGAAPDRPGLAASTSGTSGGLDVLSVSQDEQVQRGRLLVVTHVCGDCHGGFANPDAPGWLAGVQSPLQEFTIEGFTTRPRNLTPDDATGIGRFSERQIFNALRYGLRPGETPDVEITSSVPGEGNFPAYPKYLAPPMPWPSFRHMPDQDLRDIAAYLKRGVKPVSNLVEDSEGPPDFWAAAYDPAVLGTYPLPPFPAAAERTPGGSP